MQWKIYYLFFTFDIFLADQKCSEFESLQMDGSIDSNLMIESTDEENKFKLNCPESFRLDRIVEVPAVKDMIVNGMPVKTTVIVNVVEIVDELLFDCDDQNIINALDQYRCTSIGKVYVY